MLQKPTKMLRNSKCYAVTNSVTTAGLDCLGRNRYVLRRRA